MKFCTYCNSRLNADTRTSELRFMCIPCGTSFKSEPSDSLRLERAQTAADVGSTYGVLEENAPYDTAGKKVLKECPKCSMPYLTHIYLGDRMVSKYVCECGYNVLSKNYK